MPLEPLLSTIGMVARWQPPHLGHAPVLRGLCRRARRALVGIGSCNEHTARAPFTLEETSAMLRLVLDGCDNYTLIPVPDLHDGPRWRALVLDLFGPLDLFITENPYVASLLGGDYAIARPVTLVPPEERVPIDGALVRRAMARGPAWRELVPPAVADYIQQHRLDERFRREFGLATLAAEIQEG
jgi:nicotinamide-nucleotide adenylyltransferase